MPEQCPGRGANIACFRAWRWVGARRLGFERVICLLHTPYTYRGARSRRGEGIMLKGGNNYTPTHPCILHTRSMSVCGGGGLGWEEQNVSHSHPTLYTSPERREGERGVVGGQGNNYTPTHPPHSTRAVEGVCGGRGGCGGRWDGSVWEEQHVSHTHPPLYASPRKCKGEAGVLKARGTNHTPPLYTRAVDGVWGGERVGGV